MFPLQRSKLRPFPPSGLRAADEAEPSDMQARYSLPFGSRLLRCPRGILLRAFFGALASNGRSRWSSAWRLSEPLDRRRGCRHTVWSRVAMGAALPALFDSGALRRLASGALPQFERAALLDHSSAGLSGLGQLGYRQRDHGRPRPVAILATIGCSLLMAAGASEQTCHRRRHSQPNTVVRSAARRRCRSPRPPAPACWMSACCGRQIQVRLDQKACPPRN